MILFQDVERNVNLFSKIQSHKHWLMYILPVSVCMCDPATARVALSTEYDDHMCREQASSPWRRSAELPWKRGGECIGVMLCHLTHTHTHGHANTDAVSRACCMNTYFKHRFECWRRIRRISHRCVTWVHLLLSGLWMCLCGTSVACWARVYLIWNKCLSVRAKFCQDVQ